MRTVLLLVITVVVLGGGFGAYWLLQRPEVAGSGPSRGGGAPHAARPVQPADSTYTVRGGTDVWLKEFDESGRRTTQFRAAEFNPQKEGFVAVKKPEAHFFLKGGQWIRITGETGDVVVSGLPESGPNPFAGAGGTAAPSRGRLQNVHLQMYEDAGATTPTLDMEMNNAAFDNESFRIFTEGYTDETGAQIAADQVKVTVRGKYEFDGRGLTIRWNDRDRRLELLEIAHGERLVIKEPGALGTKMPGAKGATEQGGDGAGEKRVLAPASSGAPIALVSADPKAGAEAVSAARTDSTLYSIWFHDNVQVVQADQTLATGTAIEVFYAMRDTPEKPATASATESAKRQAAAAPQNVERATEAPATSPVVARENAAQANPAKEEPVVIYWTGKLRVVPSNTPPPGELEPGQSAIEMRGLPVVLNRDNVRIRCSSFTYRTSDGGVSLHNSEAFPQIEIAQFATPQRTGRPAVTLFSESVEYAPDEGVATLGGKSRAEFPADANDRSGVPAFATWTRQGVARFIGNGDETVIQSLLLTGDVDVQHPQLSLKSQRLNLAFDPPASATSRPATEDTSAPSRQPILREVVADDAVHCVLIDPDGNARELHGDHLDLSTATDAEGNLYPKTVNARGNVRAVEEGQELTAQSLAMVLAPAQPKPNDGKDQDRADDNTPGDKAPGKPDGKADGRAAGKKPKGKATSPGVELQRMVARTDVRAVSKNGDVATGQTLVVTTAPGGKPQVGLSGNPAKVASAKGDVLTSTKIIIPNPDEAQALGPGSLHALSQGKDPDAPPRHMDVTWTGSALLNGKLKENQVQVVGEVKAIMPDDEGTVNTASADRILITLTDKPVDPAVEGPATRKSGGAKDGTLASADVDVMKGRQVSRILLNKDAVVNSRQTAADGTVLREVQIDSSLLHYTVPTRRLVVPRPGRMLVRDHRPPDVRPAAAEQADGLGSQRGATAFQWADLLDYSGAEQSATMKGDVLVAYKPDDQAALPVRLRADEVVATFEDDPAKQGDTKQGDAKQGDARAGDAKQGDTQRGDARPAAAKAGGDMAGPPVRLRSVRAEGRVLVVRGGEELSAPRLIYDPISHWIRAVGTDDAPAVFTAGERGGSTTAREFQWNTETWKMRAVGAVGRASPGR